MGHRIFNGEIFVSGISNEEFASTASSHRLPRFKEQVSSNKVRIFPNSPTTKFGRTRAPIFARWFAKNLGGTTILICVFTCTGRTHRDRNLFKRRRPPVKPARFTYLAIFGKRDQNPKLNIVVFTKKKHDGEGQRNQCLLTKTPNKPGIGPQVFPT